LNGRTAFDLKSREIHRKSVPYLSYNSSGSRQHGSIKLHFTLRYLATIALLLLVSTSTVPAIQSGFLGDRGEVKTFPFKGKMVRVIGSSCMITRILFAGYSGF
jgi:hypothetical protein